MNNDIWTSIASVFTGKGGTIKLTIVGSLIAATIYEILDALQLQFYQQRDYRFSDSCRRDVSTGATA